MARIFMPNHQDMQFLGDGIKITNYNMYFSTSVCFLIMSILLIKTNPQKEFFSHNYDFSFYTASKYRDLKFDTY